jgi:histidinol-phosphate aminotransferase
VVPSYANFLYVETGYEAKADAQALLQQGVIVRPLGFMGMPQGLRVTVGTPSENHRVLEAFARLEAQPETARLRPAVQQR